MTYHTTMNCSDIMNTYIATIVSAAVEAKQDLFFDHLTSSLGLEEGAVSEAAASFDWGVDPFQSKTAAKGKKKVLPKGDGKVYLVLNYGPKSHALFGDTMAISDTVLNPLNEKCVAEGKKKVIGYNKGLAYGPGWVIIDKERVKEVETALKKAKVVYDSLEKIEYEKLRETKAKAVKDDEPEDEDPAEVEEEEQEQLEVEPIEPKVVKAKTVKKVDAKAKTTKSEAKAKKTEEAEPAEEDEEVVEAAPAKTVKAKVAKAKEVTAKAAKTTAKAAKTKDVKAKAAPKAAPKAKGRDASVSVQENKWGNYEDAQSGIVYLQLPTGINGRAESIAIGKQDSDAEYSVKGIESVLPLEQCDIDECNKQKRRVLTKSIMETLKKKDAVIFAQLDKMTKRGSAEVGDTADEAEEEEVVEEEDE